MERGRADRNLQGGSQAGGFQKRRGFATTSGQDYEVALCCLLFLRALRLSSDFLLASNHALSGKFDDVILFYALKGDRSPSYRAILLQAKHKQKPSGRKLTPLYPFCLKEYMASFRKVRSHWEKQVKIKNQLIEFEKISLVLYTNTVCAIGDTARDVTASPDVEHLRDILDTGGRLLRISDARRARLPEGPETSHFIRRLILCTEQMNVATAEKLLQAEIMKVLNLTSGEDAKKLVSELKHVVKGWWGEEGEGRYLTAQSEEWEKVLDAHMTRLNRETLTIHSQLNLSFSEAAIGAFKSVIGRRQIWVCVKDEYHVTSTRVRLLNALKSCLVLDARFLESRFREVETLWGTAVCPTLVVLDISASSSEKLLQRLRTAVHGQAGRHLVVIAKEKPTHSAWFELEAEATWSVLDAATRERLLSTQVNLQGYVVRLRDVVGLDASYSVSDLLIHSLCDAARGAMKLGESIPAPLDDYVPRCMQRISSKTPNLGALQNTNYLIFKSSMNWVLEVVNTHKVRFLSDIKRENHITRTVLVGQEYSDSEIRNLCCKFCAVGITGEKGEVTEVIPFSWMCNEKVVVLEGVPGVGKSSFVTAMCSSVKERFPGFWVLRVDMSKCSKFIQERDFRNVTDVTAFLLKDHRKGLTRELLEHSLHVTGNVFLFLDAFEEKISPNFTAKCCDLLKGIATMVRYRQMVVTTRPATSQVVEELLGGTKTFNLPVFSEDEQRLFLERFCKARGKNVDEKEISSLREKAGQMVEIPLLCRMAAEVLLHRDDISLKYENPWRKVLLYQLFVDQSINNRVAKKYDLQVPTRDVGGTLEASAKEHLHNLQELAVRKLVPANHLSAFNLSTTLPEESLGLVVDGGVDFEQRTLAEYLVGCWLARHWRRCPPQLLGQVLSREGDELVAVTLSWSLLRGSRLHEAVAQGSEADVREALLSSWSWRARARHRGGRSPLHVAAITLSPRHSVVELLLDAGQDPQNKDDFGLSAATYAETFRNWKFVEVMLHKGKSLENMKFITDPIEAKEVLVQAIRQDLTSLFKFILRLHKGIFDGRIDVKGNSPLHIAAACNNTGILKDLMEMKASLNSQNYDGQTPIHVSSGFGHAEAVRLLLRNGADPDIKDGIGRTALVVAVDRGHVQVAQQLTEKGANTGGKRPAFQRHQSADENGADLNANGTTGLRQATGCGQDNSLMEEEEEDLNLTGNDGLAALLRAAARGRAELQKILTEKGAHPNLLAKYGLRALVWAAVYGYLDAVRVLLETGADPNLLDEHGRTALMLVADEGRAEGVKVLTERGANPNVMDKDGTTALMMAANKNYVGVAALLIENGADPNLLDKRGTTALMMAANKDHVEVVKMLVEHGADPNLSDKCGNSALMMGAGKGHVEVVRILMENGADPNLLDKDGFTAFMLATVHGHLDVVNVLTGKGGDLNSLGNFGSTAAWCTRAATGGHLVVPKASIEKGAHTNLLDKEDALMWAAYEGHLDVVKVLLEKGADPNSWDDRCNTALIMAADKGHVGVVKVLTESGADANLLDGGDRTALMWAAVHGHLDVVEVLMENGADPNLLDKYGNSALMMGADNGHVEVVKMLIEKGADPNLLHKDGRTALMMAADKDHAGGVKMLMENGADPNLLHKDGRTALMMAANKDHAEVVKMLMEKGADPNLLDRNGYSALTLSADAGHPQVVKILTANGADPNLTDKYGRTALMVAAAQGRLEVVKLLAEKGADPKLKNRNGFTALMLADDQGHLEVVTLLEEYHGGHLPAVVAFIFLLLFIYEFPILIR